MDFRTGCSVLVLCAAMCLPGLVPAAVAAARPDRMLGPLIRTLPAPRERVAMDREVEVPPEFGPVLVSPPLPGRGEEYLHPGLGDHGAGMLLLAFEHYPPGGAPRCLWRLSTNDGASWNWTIGWTYEGASTIPTYPSVDRGGGSNLFCGTEVCPPDWGNGGRVIVKKFPTTNSQDARRSYWSWNNHGYSNMKMADIACTDQMAAWEWGVVTCIFDRHDGSGDWIAGNFVTQQTEQDGTAWGLFWGVPNCNTTTAAIDPVTLQAYAIWDYFDDYESKWKLVLTKHDAPAFPDGPQDGIDCALPGALQIQYPVIAANGDKVLIVAEVWETGQEQDHDLVCLYTRTGDIGDLRTAPVVSSADPECHPRIGYLHDDVFLCTYVKNQALHGAVTWDGGMTWGDLGAISGSSVVVPEYRAEDIAEFDGEDARIVWEYQEGDYIGLQLGSCSGVPPLPSACCLEEECQLLTLSACEDLGGRWLWGETCDPNPCEHPPVSCGWYGQAPPPEILGSVDTDGTAYGVAASGIHAYIADNIEGLVIIDVSDPATAHIVGSVDTPGYANGVAVQGHYAYVADYSSVKVIDVSEPTAPFVVGSVETPGSTQSLAVAGDLVYVADEAAGLQIVDVSQPESPGIIGGVDTPGTANCVAVTGGFAHVAAYGSGLQVIDVSNPTSPQVVGHADMTRYAMGVAAAGGYAYVANETNGLRVVDVSDPAHPQIVGTADTPSQAWRVALVGGYAYVADRFSGLQVIDVSDPFHPQLLGGLDTQGEAWGVAVEVGGAYIADTSFGLQIAPVQCGSFSGIGDSAPSAGGIRLWVAPNPTHAAATIRFEAPRTSRVDVEVRDIAGRLVRELRGEALALGARSLQWDGRDGGGRRVSPGAYWVRARTLEGGAAQRLILIR